MTHTVQLPFSGFYESFHNSLIDDELCSIHDVDTPEELPSNVYGKYDMRKVYLAYAQEYTTHLAQYIEDEEGLKIDLKFKTLTSPREYNFSTDTIDATISTKDLKALMKHTNQETLEELVHKAGTPVSGYMPFVSPDIHEWGKPTKHWSPSQLGLLIQALDCMTNDDYPVALCIMESASGNGDIMNALYAGEKQC